MIRKPLGGERLGSGSRMDVELHAYERATFNLSQIIRTTVSPGTLVPVLKQLALPGDTWDIKMMMEIMTHPTIGPLFGTFKAQLDGFIAPIRLYQQLLHNNKLKVGQNMSDVKLPYFELEAMPIPEDVDDIDNFQINASCVFKYLGIAGVGDCATAVFRSFNAVPWLMLWDVYKQYYANKQEGIGAVIHNTVAPVETITEVLTITTAGETQLPEIPGTPAPRDMTQGDFIKVEYTGTAPRPEDIFIEADPGTGLYDPISRYTNVSGMVDNGSFQLYEWDYHDMQISRWRYRTAADIGTVIAPTVVTFDLDDIDTMKEAILSTALGTTAFNVSDYAINNDIKPFTLVFENSGEFRAVQNTQEGLPVKTYQSDIYNNWMDTTSVEAMNVKSRVSTLAGYFTMDSLNLAEKLYDIYNRIAVSDGTYDDWIEVMYGHDKARGVYSPAYLGGLIREVAFQEVFSNAASEGQPLGTIGGRGVMTDKKKGGYVHVNVDEHAYILFLFSLTPRIDYSQGNDWDMHLRTYGDFFVSGMSQIGFQDLITEQMAYWETRWSGSAWVQRSAGKQPAWINYMTNVNKVFGNFAIPKNEMFMVLNRRYESWKVAGEWRIKDLSTYIDPVKFNQIFAQTSLDAMNFWVQLRFDMEVRRKMSGKVMPTV